MARFFGGDSDGAELSIPGSPRNIFIPSTDRREISAMFSLEDPIAEGSIKNELYRLERIRGEKQTFKVYVHSDMSIDQMLHKAIQNYGSLPEVMQSNERNKFESMMKLKGLSVSRHAMIEGCESEYRHCAVQLAWESWLESARYSRDTELKFSR